MGSVRNGWNIQLRRDLNDLEIDHMAQLLGYLDLFQVRLDREDHCKWLLVSNGRFSIKLCYELFGVQGVGDFC